MRTLSHSFALLALLTSAGACGGANSGGGSGGQTSGSGAGTGTGATSSGGIDAGSSTSSGGTGTGATVSSGGTGAVGTSGGAGGAATGGGGNSSGGNSGGVGGAADGGASSGGRLAGGAGGTPAGGGTAGIGGDSGGSGGQACVVDHGTEEPALGEYYKDYFAIGAAIDTKYASYSSILTKHFNSVTAEDQMKFDALEPTEGAFSYGTADQMVNFAVQNGMQVRGHTLVWHRQTPSWVFSGSPTQVLARMKNHINNVMQHFQGKVKTWDVVNEAIMDDGKFRTGNETDGQQSQWYGTLGESYIAEAFRAARQADPTAKLFYNDYYNYHPVRRQAIYDMLAGLIANGVPIDGVGLQTHLNLEPGTDPNEQSYYQTVDNLALAIEMYSSLGLDVHITEMDLSLYLRGITYTSDMFYTPAKFTPELQVQQADRYREFFEMFRAHRDMISSVTFWGIADDNTWLSEFDSGRQDFPLLFDTQHETKAAYWAVIDFCN